MFAAIEAGIEDTQVKTLEIAQFPQFNAPDISATLDGMPDPELHALPFGVVEMNREYTVLRYNATVAQHYDLDALDETVAYTFSLRMRPVPVTLRMLKRSGSGRMYLLVAW